MWNDKVEETNIWSYVEKENFDIIYNDIRFLTLYINTKAKEVFKNYIGFKVDKNDRADNSKNNKKKREKR